MASAEGSVEPYHSDESLSSRFLRIRSNTVRLCENLQTEDFVVQSMPDVSPTKWHLAHVTWFFERFVLTPNLPNYEAFHPRFDYLFNSYYYGVGEMHKRPRRGLLSRPTVSMVMRYREHVDNAVTALLKDQPGNADIQSVVILGLHHEQQHQELLLTDIKHVFSCNPLHPELLPARSNDASAASSAHEFIEGSSGIKHIGATGDEFCFDNELPRHKLLIHPHALGSRLITNGEYLEFIKDGGYTNSELWLSDGWAAVNERQWQRPLYWSEDLQSEFTLSGNRDIDWHAPVAHVSYYEADAFARWAGARLPLESEWEVAAAKEDITGNFVETGAWQTLPAREDERQLFGDVWEWTASAYSAYPGFKPLEGNLGEYNGKFMSGQMTVRGGSCVTAEEHIRATYRSFFYRDARWQFLGIRLAKDL
jgi:ergothioneine biosynthesis protein EgtB